MQTLVNWFFTVLKPKYEAPSLIDEFAVPSGDFCDDFPTP